MKTTIKETKSYGGFFFALWIALFSLSIAASCVIAAMDFSK